MKKTTLLLLFCLTLTAAKCQEPDTIICYSEADMEMERQLRYDTIEYFESLIAFKDSLLNNSFNYFGANQDTFLYTISGVTDSLTVEVNKEGQNVWITLIDGSKRAHLDLFNNKRTITLAEDNQTVGLWRPE